MAKKKKAPARKIKKKKWFPIKAPNIFGEKTLGESILTDPNDMKGRHMTLNLMNITGSPKNQNANIQFKIKDVKDGQGITKVVKYELISSFIKRVVRRGRTKIDDSFIAKTSDYRVRIKPIIITNTKVPKSVASKLRLQVRKILKDKLKKVNFEKAVDEVLKGNFEKDVKNTIADVTPIRNFHIRILKVEHKKGEKEEVKEEIEEPEEKVEETKEEKEDEPEKKTEKKDEKKKEPKEEKKKEDKSESKNEKKKDKKEPKKEEKKSDDSKDKKKSNSKKKTKKSSSKKKDSKKKDSDSE
mgnify:CR=1 FL=1